MRTITNLAQRIERLGLGDYTLESLVLAFGCRPLDEPSRRALARELRPFHGVALDSKQLTIIGKSRQRIYRIDFTPIAVREDVPLVSFDVLANDERFAILENHKLPLDARKLEFLRVDGYFFVKAGEGANEALDELMRAKLAAGGFKAEGGAA